MAGFVALTAVLALASAAGPTQELPTLHITALGMHADRGVVAPGQAFHLTIHVHVTEPRARLDELVLPDFTDALDLGDERRRVGAPDGGTDFYEIITVAADRPGEATFSPAYIDAIDPATGRAMRYSSQSVRVRVRVRAGAAAPNTALGAAARAVAFTLAAFVALGLLLAFALVRAARPRRRAAPPARAVPRAPLDPVRGSRLSAAVAALRACGDAAALDALRAVLFERAGVRGGGTLADALEALGGRDPELARVMAVAERMRFGPAAERAAARAQLLALLYDYVRDREPGA